MGTVVLGAGVIGVATAYWLAKAGEAVTVVDRAPEPAADTSHANTGMITPSQSASWARPGMPRVLLRAVLGRLEEVRVRPLRALSISRWGLAFLGRCNARDAAKAFAVNLELNRHSQRRLAEIREETGIDDDRTAAGTLRLLWSAEALDSARATMAGFRAAGLSAELLDPAACTALEPSLGSLAGRLAGGLYCPDDETGDCAAFTRRLAEWLGTRGVAFRFGTAVTGLHVSGGRVVAVATASGPIAARRVVVALGRASRALLRPLGIRLPIAPVKGYSLTIPVGDRRRLPRVPVIDEARAVGLTPMDARLRVGGFLDVGVDDTQIDEGRARHMLAIARDIFPDCVAAAPAGEIRRWACVRALTPDGPPILGRTPVENLYLNTGHGSHGWTMACGSGHVVADLITGRPPAIGTTGLTLDRFGA